MSGTIIPAFMVRDETGELTVIFPTLPGTNDPDTMMCYAHIGQHNICHQDWVAETTKVLTTMSRDTLLLRQEVDAIYNIDGDEIQWVGATVTKSMMKGWRHDRAMTIAFVNRGGRHD